MLDVGCGPGRHSHALARRGIDVVGLDIAEPFVLLAARAGVAGTAFARGDAAVLPVRSGAFDAVVSLCQGGFGLAGDDSAVLAELARALRPGGLLALSAFSAYFAVRDPQEGEEFDANAGVNHERTSIRNEAGDEREFDLWTACYTPRELRLLCARAGLTVRDLWSVAPGDYARRPPDLHHPELLVVAERAKASVVELHPA